MMNFNDNYKSDSWVFHVFLLLAVPTAALFPAKFVPVLTHSDFFDDHEYHECEVEVVAVRLKIFPWYELVEVTISDFILFSFS